MSEAIPKWFTEEMKKVERLALAAKLPGLAHQVGIARTSPAPARVTFLRDRGENILNPGDMSQELRATVKRLYLRAAAAVEKLLLNEAQTMTKAAA